MAAPTTLTGARIFDGDLWLRNAKVLDGVESAILAPGFTASPDTSAAKV